MIHRQEPVRRAAPFDGVRRKPGLMVAAPQKEPCRDRRRAALPSAAARRDAAHRGS